MEWIFFAAGVVVIGLVGIGIGLFVAGRLTGWAERRGTGDDSAGMTPVGRSPDSAGDAGPPDVAGTDGESHEEPRDG